MRRHTDYENILRWIINYKIEHDGNSPSYREIAEANGFKTTSAIDYVLVKLEKAGHLERRGNESRSIFIKGGEWTFKGEA